MYFRDSLCAFACASPVELLRIQRNPRVELVASPEICYQEGIFYAISPAHTSTRVFIFRSDPRHWMWWRFDGRIQELRASPAIALKAQPSTVTSGASTMLSWNASNADSVSISGVGIFPASGSVKLTPIVTTTYTATATGPAGKAESSTVVSVTTSGQKPTVAFSAQPSNIAPGASAVLTWTTTNAASVSIAGVGTFAANGSVKVTPTSTVAYTATATGPGGTAASTTTVTVGPSQNPPPTIAFNAQPNSIPSGATVVLTWTTRNATSVSIPGVGNVRGKWIGSSHSEFYCHIHGHGDGSWRNGCVYDDGHRNLDSSAYDFLQRSTQYHQERCHGGSELDHQQRDFCEHCRVG